VHDLCKLHTLPLNETSGLLHRLLVEHVLFSMATQTTTADFAHEKQDVQYVENVRETPDESSHDLQKERTLEGIDMNNSYAVKGDDSDGKVEWTVRSMFAAVFLAALYTGMISIDTEPGFIMLMIRRLSSHSLLCRSLPWVHRRRPWTRTRLRMATNCQHPCHRSGMSLCWVSPRLVWQTLHRTFRLRVHLHRLCAGRIWA
jgi:hypothetical protein